MLRHARGRITPSVAISFTALLIALGGTSYAVTKLPANSVGTKQIRTGAVTSSDVKNGSLRQADFRRGQLTPKVVPRGTTLRGAYALRGDSGTLQTGISFGTGLASAPTANYIVAGASGGSQCPGTTAAPAAAAGQLCVYEATADNANTRVIFDTTTGTNDVATTFGAGIGATAVNIGQDTRVRDWAVTAP